ncbi:MAG: hypothetical protein DDG59_15335 [Anaerolineae bacterium]|jgi:purine-binding chemotaxis protein CheW|nr:MAG: hypothetical protein DDG59_15335 [Anaerolineae bacterium]
MSERKKKVEAALNNLFSTPKPKAVTTQSPPNDATVEASPPPQEKASVQPRARAKSSADPASLSFGDEVPAPQSASAETQAVERGETPAAQMAAAARRAEPAPPTPPQVSSSEADPSVSLPKRGPAGDSQPLPPATPAPSGSKKGSGNGHTAADAGVLSFDRETTSEEIDQLVIFTLAGESFGLPIERVESIIKPQAITVVPHARPYVVGVTNLRGTVLPVIDLRRRFRLAAMQESDEQRIVVVLFNDEKIGLMVDSVSQVLRLPRTAIEPPPPIVTAFVQSAFVTGIAKVDERLVILLDLEKVLLPEHGN